MPSSIVGPGTQTFFSLFYGLSFTLSHSLNPFRKLREFSKWTTLKNDDWLWCIRLVCYLKCKWCISVYGSVRQSICLLLHLNVIVVVGIWGSCDEEPLLVLKLPPQCEWWIPSLTNNFSAVIDFQLSFNYQSIPTWEPLPTALYYRDAHHQHQYNHWQWWLTP